jgi:uncharacterized cupredoxin-like copper-binding protein
LRQLRVWIVVCLCLAATAVAGSALAARTGGAVSVKASEFKFVLSTKSVKAGSVTFTVKNAGKLPHDFKIGGKKTPSIAPGKSAKLKVTLKKGKAAYLCTVPGHAAAGMKGTVTVK